MTSKNAFDYFVPAREVTNESVFQKSRFIGFISRIHDVKDAKTILARIKLLYPNADHYVHAYVVGYGSVVTTHCNDDGEPPGTAGRPVLAVLQNSLFGDISIVVIRYFGGIKLGTGGLVRAYQEITKRTLELVPKAKKLLTSLLEISSEYHHYQGLEKCILAHGGYIIDKNFSERVFLKAHLPFHILTQFLEEIRDLSSGSTTVNVVVEQEMTVMPLTDEGLL